MEINEIIRRAGEHSKKAGFRDASGRSFVEKLCLVHSEISEALEEYLSSTRVIDTIYYVSSKGPSKAKPSGIPIELADVVIHVADICDEWGIDLDSAIRQKLDYNESRPYLHGGKKL